MTTSSPTVVDQRAASWPHRRIFTCAEALIALSALAGTAQLFAAGAPLKSELPLGLPAPLVPGLWLFFLVAVTAALASWLCWRRSAWGPTAVLVASTGLGIDVVAQIPFVGFNVLQLVFGAVAVAMALLALDAWRRGWRRSG
jgi:hypothetical protein